MLPHAFPRLTNFLTTSVLYLLQSPNEGHLPQIPPVWSCSPTNANLYCKCYGYELRHIPLHRPSSESESLSSASQFPCTSFRFLFPLLRPASHSACYGDIHVNISCVDLSSTPSKTYQFATVHSFNATPQRPMQHLVIHIGPYNRPTQSRFQSTFWRHGGIACFLLSFLFLATAMFLMCLPNPTNFKKMKRLLPSTHFDLYACFFLWRGLKVKVPSQRLSPWQHSQIEDEHTATLFMKRGAQEATMTCISHPSSISSRLIYNPHSAHTSHYPPHSTSTGTSSSTISPTLSLHFGAHISQPSNRL